MKPGSPVLQAVSLPAEPPGKPRLHIRGCEDKHLRNGRDDGLAGTRGKARAEGPRYAKVSAACGQSGAPCPLQAWAVKTGGPARSQADRSPAPAAPPCERHSSDYLDEAAPAGEGWFWGTAKPNRGFRLHQEGEECFQKPNLGTIRRNQTALP